MTALASTFLIFFILSSYKDTHKRFDEFEILQDPTKDLAALEHLEKIPIDL